VVECEEYEDELEEELVDPDTRRGEIEGGK
jgi:hypothetical protein